MKVVVHRTYKINTGNYESIDVGASVELADSDIHPESGSSSEEVFEELLDTVEDMLAAALAPALAHAKELAKAGNQRSIAFRVQCG